MRAPAMGSPWPFTTCPNATDPDCSGVTIFRVRSPASRSWPAAVSSFRETESELFRQLAMRHGIAAHVVDAQALQWFDGRLWHGDRVIDLSGRSPTSIYAIGGQPIALAWMIGGYPGSADFVQTALQRVPCTVRTSAWVITEPEGVRPLPFSVLEDFPRAYETIGALMRPGPQPAMQYLYKPRLSPAAITAQCGDTR